MNSRLRRKRAGWVGFISFLGLAGLIFVFMLVYGPLTVSPGYPQDLAFRVVVFSYFSFVLSLLGAIVFGIFLCRTYELHPITSIGEWLRTKGEAPWKV
jgi:hypothetical protein